MYVIYVRGERYTLPHCARRDSIDGVHALPQEVEEGRVDVVVEGVVHRRGTAQDASVACTTAKEANNNNNKKMVRCDVM